MELTKEKMIKDTFDYIIKCRDNFLAMKDAELEDFETVLFALKDTNVFITECLLLENYIKEEQAGLQYKNTLSRIVSVRQTLQTFNQSLTAILRAITLLQRYKNDTGELIELDRNKYCVLYRDDTSDCYLLYHMRSGQLIRYNYPFLTRSENQELAQQHFAQAKHIENTN